MAIASTIYQQPQPTTTAPASTPYVAPAAVAPIAAPVTGGSSFINSLLPGLSGLTSRATGDISNLLNGLPSTSQARTTNAYWGAGAGTPAGGAGTTGDINSFIGARGTDLYGQQAAEKQQTGLQDLLQMIGTYSAPALQAQSQAQQANQFGQNLAQQGSQFGQNLALGQQEQAFNQGQTDYTSSPAFLQMLADLKNYGTTSAPTKQTGSSVSPIIPVGTTPGTTWVQGTTVGGGHYV